jgi:2-methylisocitrate lyase-like PEP mutase family enzyme
MTSTDGRGARLRARLASGLLVAPGVADAFEARMVAQAGYDAVYVSGAAVANKLLGAPDLGLVTATEMADALARICDAVDVPVIADADTGYGNVLNAQRTVRAYARAGVAALHIEDQVFPKRCGHFDGKQVIGQHEAAHKIRAACDARPDDDAIARANAFAEAGADLLFVDALEQRAQIEMMPRHLHRPVLFNMVEGAKTPQVTHAELAGWGYALVIHPSFLLRVQAKAARNALARLRADGGSHGLRDEMLTFDDRQQIVDLPGYTALERRYGAKND